MFGSANRSCWLPPWPRAHSITSSATSSSSFQRQRDVGPEIELLCERDRPARPREGLARAARHRVVARPPEVGKRKLAPRRAALEQLRRLLGERPGTGVLASHPRDESELQERFGPPELVVVGAEQRERLFETPFSVRQVKKD